MTTTKKKSTKEKSGTPRKRGPSKAARPYDNDLEYLQDELAWIEARARRVGAQIKMQLCTATAREIWGPAPAERTEEAP